MLRMPTKDQIPCIIIMSLICLICIATCWHHHHNNNNSWTNNNSNNIRKEEEKPTQQQTTTKSAKVHRHLLILMGRGVHLKAWKQLFVNLDSSPDHLTHDDDVALVLGIFDDDVATLECSSSSANRRVSCVSVAGTTWTTGRNKLIETAFALELEQNTTYSFWTLADADILLHCHHHYHSNHHQNNNNNSPSIECFKQYDTFLSKLPENAAAATLIANGSWSSTPNAAMIHLHAMDAAWNSFRHNTLQILFPYRPDLDAITWWSSQAIFWHRLQCLAPLYVVTPLYIFYVNQEHTDYPRNPRNYTEEHRIGRLTVGKKLSAILEQAPSHYSLEFKQEKIRPLPLVVAAAVEKQPMDKVFYLCLKEFSLNLSSSSSSSSINALDVANNLGDRQLVGGNSNLHRFPKYNRLPLLEIEAR